jgi:hypothetical protein
MWRERLASASRPLATVGSLTPSVGLAITDQAELASPGRCRDKQPGKEEDVYIGIGTVLAIIVIILLLIWIF